MVGGHAPTRTGRYKLVFEEETEERQKKISKVYAKRRKQMVALYGVWNCHSILVRVSDINDLSCVLERLACDHLSVVLDLSFKLYLTHQTNFLLLQVASIQGYSSQHPLLFSYGEVGYHQGIQCVKNEGNFNFTSCINGCALSG